LGKNDLFVIKLYVLKDVVNVIKNSQVGVKTTI
jgi:hypothetical protein